VDEAEQMDIGAAVLAKVFDACRWHSLEYASRVRDVPYRGVARNIPLTCGISATINAVLAPFPTPPPPRRPEPR